MSRIQQYLFFYFHLAFLFTLFFDQSMALRIHTIILVNLPLESDLLDDVQSRFTSQLQTNIIVLILVFVIY